MEVVAVTGASGLVGRFVVDRLLKCGRYKEIRLIDRKPSARTDADDVRVRPFVLDLVDEGALERALNGCNSVVHCAHAAMPWKYIDRKTNDDIWRDNLSVHVGDAYSALPIEDNYGLGEYVFKYRNSQHAGERYLMLRKNMMNDYPGNYILGEYGESHTRAEMYARNAVARARSGPSLQGVFLRPVHVYAEQGSSSWITLMEMAQEGHVPYVKGDRRGLHQFIYAGNLAAIVDRCLLLLAKEPDRVNSEIVYCVDETSVIPFRDFLEQRVRSPRFSSQVAISFEKAFLQQSLNYIKHTLGFEVPKNALSFTMFRFLFAKTIGFSNRKQRLLLDFVPEVMKIF
uniref:Epimerase domain-containing protein n=1 Tax=Angiostrongylus cantonensis TaxID=6313 RepID=A0A0K0DJP9_ANGCA